ncbi:hypothetical protein KKE03_04195 [Patescibacteria group bacterium]|nr:hypothetical protein [Patescibacteria group bacterium]
MKAFIAYRSTGEDPQAVEPVLIAIREAFKGRGIEAYSTFFDEAIEGKSLGVRQIMEHAFGIIDNADFLFVVQTSDNKSEGMLIEVGYCMAKRVPIIAATKDTVTKTYVPAIASQSFKWSTIEDLARAITDLQL